MPKMFKQTKDQPFDGVFVINVDPNTLLNGEFTDIPECYNGLVENEGTEKQKIAITNPGVGVINVADVNGELYVFGFSRHNPETPDADRQFTTAIGGTPVLRAKETEPKANFIIRKQLPVVMNSKGDRDNPGKQPGNLLLSADSNDNYNLLPHAVVFRKADWDMCYVSLIRKFTVSKLSELAELSNKLTFGYEYKSKKWVSDFDAIKLSDLTKIASISAPVEGEAAKNAAVEAQHKDTVITAKGNTNLPGKLKVFDDIALDALMKNNAVLQSLKPPVQTNTNKM